MANEENLVPFGKGNRSKSEERELQAKGGRNSGVTRRRNRDIKAATRELMNTIVPDNQSKIIKAMSVAGIDEDEMTYAMAVVLAQMNKALKGDSRAANFLLKAEKEDETSKNEIKKDDDGFIDALGEVAGRLFVNGDDSSIIPNEEKVNEGI